MRLEHGGLTNRVFIGEVDSFKEMNKLISRYIKSIHFKSYYQIINFEPEAWRVDYGSYTDFIWVSQLPENAEDKYKEEVYVNSSGGEKL